MPGLISKIERESNTIRAAGTIWKYFQSKCERKDYLQRQLMNDQDLQGFEDNEIIAKRSNGRFSSSLQAIRAGTLEGPRARPRWRAQLRRREQRVAEPRLLRSRSLSNFIKISSNYSKIFINFCIQYSIFQLFFNIYKFL